MTLNNDCEKLDAYLTGDLSDQDCAHFELHVEECAACREAVDQQLWIDGLLQSSARIQLEIPPTAIFKSVCSSLTQRRRRVLQAACGLAAAAVLIVAFGWLELNRQAMRRAVPEAQSVAVIEAVHAPALVPPPATFISTADAIAVPLESPAADVTVVQVYPTTDTERRWQLELTLSSKATLLNGG